MVPHKLDGEPLRQSCGNKGRALSELGHASARHLYAPAHDASHQLHLVAVNLSAVCDHTPRRKRRTKRGIRFVYSGFADENLRGL